MSSMYKLQNTGKVGPYKPTLILHGGAGSITRENLPPGLYSQYSSSLLNYLKATHQKLQSVNSLDAACYAVSLLEDDPLFNCGKGSVFTEAGTIEMEASVMVSSVSPDGPPEGRIKRAAAVSLVRETRHPILLAKEVLLDGGDGLGGTASMHCHLSGREVEKWGWEKRGLERKGIDWFWTKKRWEEHLRALKGLKSGQVEEVELPSQGTVGAVCMDSWGNLAVATSTGGLTNKKVGRIGDTPTVGAGFWAESWDLSRDTKETMPQTTKLSWFGKTLETFEGSVADLLRDCLPHQESRTYEPLRQKPETTTGRIDEKVPDSDSQQSICSQNPLYHSPRSKTAKRAVAMSGTGNGDSFLRTNAVRTSAAISKFKDVSLASAVTAVSGPDGELQKSAGDRWKKTGEGQGGIVGIELHSDSPEGKVVFDFNCGGLWRAWIDEQTGIERVMVFREDYDVA